MLICVITVKSDERGAAELRRGSLILRYLLCSAGRTDDRETEKRNSMYKLQGKHRGIYFTRGFTLPGKRDDWYTLTHDWERLPLCFTVICCNACGQKAENKHWFPIEAPPWTDCACDCLMAIQRETAHQPVMHVVKRSPQDTDLMVTPDWPSRKREMNCGCICSTTPGRLGSADPTEGACDSKWSLYGSSSREREKRKLLPGKMHPLMQNQKPSYINFLEVEKWMLVVAVCTEDYWGNCSYVLLCWRCTK